MPTFINKTSAFEIERVLTDRVRSEFGSRGKYRVQPDTNNVDAILTGTIVSVRFDNTAYTRRQPGRAPAVDRHRVVRVQGRAREQSALDAGPSCDFREEFEPTTATGTDAAAFLGGNTNALERLAQTFARSLVTTILEAF